MFSGDTLTADIHTRTAAHVLQAWDIPASSSSARMPIAALREEDEDDPPSHRPQDLEQTLSAALRSSAAREHTPDCASPSNVSNVSASPAAAFLSFFSSPTPQQQVVNPDDEGQVVSAYTLGPIIGYGATSIIRRATSSSGTQAAVKIVRRSDLVKAGNAPQARRKLEHEAAVWGTLSHEHILPLFSVVHHTYADYFFTLYCPAGTLLDILNRDGSPALPQDDAGMMLRQVVRGLRYLHEIAGYVHRDLKLENVLVDEMGVCKIGDFGMSRRIDSVDDADDDQEDYHHLPSFGLGSASNNNNAGVHRAVSLAAPQSKRGNRSQLNHPHHAVGLMHHSIARHRNSTSTNEPVHTFQPGSLPYAAPELLLPQTSEGRRPHPSQDIWALGVMLYALLTGRLPFTDNFEPRLQMKILNGYYTVPPGIGKGAERILAGCLTSAVQERWTIAMVDEVSWGVGWGAEGDDAAAHNDSDDDHLPLASSRSRSHSRPPPQSSASSTASDWQLDEPQSRGSQEAASRRSTSRAKRSLSRVPLMPGSGRRSASRHEYDYDYDYGRGSRSASRHPTRSRSPVSASATVSFATASASGSTAAAGPVSASAAVFPRSHLQHRHPPPPVPLRTPSSSTSTTSFSYLGTPHSEEHEHDAESALDVSPSSQSASPFPSPPLLPAPPPPRGRPQNKFQPQYNHSTSSRSRSASPSVVPTTPRDGPLVAGVVDSPHEEFEDLSLDANPAATAMRGRRPSRKDQAPPPLMPAQGPVMVGQLSLAMAAAEAEAMARSDSYASASDSVGSIDSAQHGGDEERRHASRDHNDAVASDRPNDDGSALALPPSSALLHRRRAASTQPRRNQRPTSSPPAAGGPRMLAMAPPAPLDPFLTPASVTATSSTVAALCSRSAHPRG